MKLKERLLMVTIGFTFAIVLFAFQDFFLIDSASGFAVPSLPSFGNEKLNANKFHGQINGKANKKGGNHQDAESFKQRNLQKTGSGSNAARGGRGIGGEDKESATKNIHKKDTGPRYRIV